MRNRRSMTPQRRGMALLIVLAILGLLSILAISFVQMARLERSISRNYVDRTRAILAAESGIEYALSRVRNFHGGALRPDELADLRFNEGKVSFSLPGDASMSGYLGESSAPSEVGFRLRVQDESGKLNLNDSNGTWNIDTDALPDAEDFGAGDDGDVGESWPRLTKTIESLVDVLFSETPGLGGLAAAALMDARELNYGGRFANFRQVEDALVGGGVLSEQQYAEFRKHVTLWSRQDPGVLKPNFKVALSVPSGETQPADNFDLYLWSDYQNDVYALEPRCPVNVNTCSPELLQALIRPLRGWYLKEGPADTTTTHTYSAWNGGFFFVGMGNNELNQQFFHKDERPVTPSPVDGLPCYQAADGRVLMTDGRLPLQSLSIPPKRELEIGGRVGNKYGSLRVTLPFTPGKAKAIAERIRERIDDPVSPRPFVTWEEFHDFLKNRDGDGLTHADVLPNDDELEVEPGVSVNMVDPVSRAWWRRYYFETYTDLLIAMFNPNADLNDFNPNRNLWRRIDKGQLTSYTTELSFLFGTHVQVLSEGVVSGVDAETTVRIEAAMQVFDVWSVSSQAQFHDGVASSDGPETYFSQSKVSPFRTFGAARWDSDGFGYTVQSYPEPFVAGAVDELSASRYDGQLMLATYEYKDATYATVCLQASFSDGLKPHIFGNHPGSPTALGELDTDDLYLNAPEKPDAYEDDATGYHFSEGYNYPTDGPLTWRRSPGDARYDAAANGQAGVLYPDGAFSEAGRTVGFRAANAFYEDESEPGWDLAYRYSVFFWCKPNFSAALSNRIRKLFTFEESKVRGPVWVSASFPGLYYFPHHFLEEDIVHSQTLKLYFEGDGIGTLGTALNGMYTIPGWMVPHSLSFMIQMGTYSNFGGSGFDQSVNNFGGTATHRTCHDFPEHDPSRDTPSIERLNFEGQVWSYCRMGYDIGSGPLSDIWVPDMYFSMSVNGWEVPESDKQMYWQAYGPNKDYRLAMRYEPYSSAPAREVPNYLRLGEFDTAMSTRYVADSTFDEFVVLPVADASHDVYLKEYWNDGRYLSFTDAEGTAGVYTSPLYSAKEMVGAASGDALLLHSVAWTLYWPRNNRGLDSDTSNRDAIVDNVIGRRMNPDDPDDPTVPYGWDPVSIDVRIAKAGGNAAQWMGESTPGSPDKSRMPSYAGGSSLKSLTGQGEQRLERGDALQFRVYFNLGDNAATPLYESPVLDDVTFTLMLTRPRVLHWQVLN